MRLFLFTNFFPFKGSEPFLVNEFNYTHTYFSNIDILPLYGQLEDTSIKAIVHQPVFEKFKATQILSKGLFNSKNFGYHFKEVLQLGLIWQAKKLYWNISGCLIARAFQNHPIFNLIIKQSKTETCVLYFYWGDGMVNAIPYLVEKANVVNLKIVIRFHGSDLYEHFKSNYSPLRKEIFKHVNLLCTVSETGKNYLIQKYPEVQSKIFVSKLGVAKNEFKSLNSSETITIVSASSIIPLKRVKLIFESLQLTKTKINWHHFGAGEGLRELTEIVKNARQSLSVKLHGLVTNQVILNFYKQNPVHLFINLSTSEGIPVSIMEAYSFGIPAIATNVGGTGELVNNNNGRLINVDCDAQSIAKTIEELIQKPVEEFTKLKEEAHRKFESDFSAEHNYPLFYEKMLEFK
jgi:glycosyltransferase involved in cell wall biosynthesis